jgi:sugar/nucleoside kinase (ribokinase family)
VQRPWDLAAVGEVLVDVTAAGLVPGEVVHGPVRLQPGGTPVNAAFAAAAIGASCVVVGRVGADPAGTMLRASLLVAGIDAHLAGDGRTPTGMYLETGAGEGRSIVADRGASACLAVDDIPDPLVAGAVLVSGYALLHDDTAPAASAALRRARARHTALLLAAPGLLRRLGPDEVRRRAAGADVLLANAEEARALTGHDPDAAVAELARSYGLACVTSGADGAVAAAAGGPLVRSRPSAPLPGDVTGAGDAFAAYFLVALVRGASLQEALDAACQQ